MSVYCQLNANIRHRRGNENLCCRRIFAGRSRGSQM